LGAGVHGDADIGLRERRCVISAVASHRHQLAFGLRPIAAIKARAADLQYCALSRERELPEWLDRSIETRHANLPLAILIAFVDAQRITTPSSRTSVPTAPYAASGLYEPVLSDNFA
jgi:hypothetical protein